eukprot:scaffold577859_cov46-Prasinocladus_malaysianus.AAC.1
MKGEQGDSDLQRYCRSPSFDCMATRRMQRYTDMREIIWDALALHASDRRRDWSTCAVVGSSGILR